MSRFKTNLSKSSVQKALFAFQVVGFLLAVATCWLTELLDPPFSFSQVSLETMVLVILGAAVIWVTDQLIKRIKYLEGFLVICASCKRIKIDENWNSIESVIAAKSDLLLSHGICPDCAEKLYGKFLHKKRPAQER